MSTILPLSTPHRSISFRRLTALPPPPPSDLAQRGLRRHADRDGGKRFGPRFAGTIRPNADRGSLPRFAATMQVALGRVSPWAAGRPGTRIALGRERPGLGSGDSRGQGGMEGVDQVSGRHGAHGRVECGHADGTDVRQARSARSEQAVEQIRIPAAMDDALHAGPVPGAALAEPDQLPARSIGDLTRARAPRSRSDRTARRAGGGPRKHRDARRRPPPIRRRCQTRPHRTRASSTSSVHHGDVGGTTMSTHSTAPGSSSTNPPPLCRVAISTPASRQASTSNTSDVCRGPRTIAGRSTANDHSSTPASPTIERPWNSTAEPVNRRTVTMRATSRS